MGSKTEIKATKSFTAEMYLHGSWGARDVGKHASTMDLTINTAELRGDIEWDIPTMDTVEQIGFQFERNADGKLVLTDYDGIMSLPKEAVMMLEEQGVIVDDDFKD